MIFICSLIFLPFSYIGQKRFISLILIIITLGSSQSSYAEQDPFALQTLRTGFYLAAFADISRADMEVALRFWTEEIGKQVGIPASVEIYTDIASMNKDFTTGKINFIVASPLPILTEFGYESLAGGFKVLWGGNGGERLLLLAHKDSKLGDLNSLYNKRLSLLLNDPVPLIFADILALENFSKTASEIFSNVNYENKSNQLIYQLFFKQTDVVIVYQASYDLATELNPQIRRYTEIIAALPPIPRALGYFHYKVAPEFREKVLLEVEKLDTHPRGEQLLAIFQAEKIVRSQLSDLKGTERLQQNYRELSQQKGYR